MPAPTVLRTAIEGALTRLSPQVADKVLTCDLRLPAPDVRVPLSRQACELVVGHLLRNALKHTPAGTTIAIATAVLEDEVVLSIADQGPGIPPHRLASIGDGRRLDRGQPGQGQGLRRTRDLLKPAGGRLTWRNGEVGAVFEVTLPLAR